MASLYDVIPAPFEALIPASELHRPIRLGHYQIDTLIDRSAWSGADLRGKAARYAGRYTQSRANALARIQDLDIDLYGITVGPERVNRHGRLAIVWRWCGLTVPQYLRACERPGLAGMFAA